jgi:hypothetical protein
VHWHPYECNAHGDPFCECQALHRGPHGACPYCEIPLNRGWHQHLYAGCGCHGIRCVCEFPHEVLLANCSKCVLKCLCCQTKMSVDQARKKLCYSCALGHEPGKATRLHTRRITCDCCKAVNRTLTHTKCNWCRNSCGGGEHVKSGPTAPSHYHACPSEGCHARIFKCDCPTPLSQPPCGYCNMKNANQGKVHQHYCGCGVSWHCVLNDRASRPSCATCAKPSKTTKQWQTDKKQRVACAAKA